MLLRVGPFYPEHPSTVFVYMFLFQKVVRLGFKLRHLSQVTDNMTREQWAERRAPREFACEKVIWRQDRL